MSQLKLIENNWLRADDLQIGHCYLYKDGRLVVYIGRSSCNEFVFYEIASCLYKSTDSYYIHTLAHYEDQVKMLSALAIKIMGKKIDITSLVVLKGMPKLYCEFPYCDFESTLGDWWEKNIKAGAKLPELTQNAKKNAKNIYVGAKDIVPGELYYTGGLWRSLYLYLGRDSQKNFCWYFVGNENILRRNDLREYLVNCERTKSNKHVKKLEQALNDRTAYMYEDAQRLLNEHWTANLRGLDLG